MIKTTDTIYFEKEYNINDLIEMNNGLYTEKFSDIPITGKVFENYGEKSNPKKVHMGNLLFGKKEGKWVGYHPNGRKQFELNFKNGKEDGSQTHWYPSGQKYLEGTFKDGKRISFKEWNEDGSVRE